MPGSQRSVLPAQIDEIQKSYEDAHDTSPKHRKKKKASKVLEENNYYNIEDTVSSQQESSPEQFSQKIH